MNTNTTYIGIDGGISGALCVIDTVGKLVDKTVMPILPIGNGRNEYDCQKIIEFLSMYSDAIIILEKAQFTPKLGGIASFSFGKSYGTMIGIIAALKRKHHLIAARTWQKAMLQDTNSEDTKKASMLVAKRLFPEHTFLATERSKKMHSGLTDAALIAEFGRRHNL